MKFGYAICGVACASLALALVAGLPQDAKVHANAPMAAPGKPAAVTPGAGKAANAAAAKPNTVPVANQNAAAAKPGAAGAANAKAPKPANAGAGKASATNAGAAKANAANAGAGKANAVNADAGKANAVNAGAGNANAAGTKAAGQSAAKPAVAPGSAAAPAPAAPADAAAAALAATQDGAHDGAHDGRTLAMKVMSPGAHHKPLMDLHGNWTLAVKSTADPGATPVESKATSAFTIIMEGRYLVETVVGEGPMGPFNGMGLYGFNVMANEYENVWVDNMGTGMWKSTGTWDEGSQSLRWRGEMISLKNGGKMKTHAIMKKVSDTQYDYVLMEERGDKLFKSLEIVYTKA